MQQLKRRELGTMVAAAALEGGGGGTTEGGGGSAQGRRRKRAREDGEGWRLGSGSGPRGWVGLLVVMETGEASGVGVGGWAGRELAMGIRPGEVRECVCACGRWLGSA